MTKRRIPALLACLVLLTACGGALLWTLRTLRAAQSKRACRLRLAGGRPVRVLE